MYILDYVVILDLLAIPPTLPYYTMQTYKIIESRDGERAVFIPSTREIIPCDMAGLMAGKDKWLSEIFCECRECEEEHPIRNMYANGQYCGMCSINHQEECLA